MYYIFNSIAFHTIIAQNITLKALPLIIFSQELFFLHNTLQHVPHVKSTLGLLGLFFFNCKFALMLHLI